MLASRLGLVSALAVVGLELAYAAMLALGLAALPAPDLPIADPWFTAMEVLILALGVPLITLMIAVHAVSPAPRRPLALAALIFMAMTVCLTSIVHFSVLTLSRDPAFVDQGLALAFEWPSAVYALDILAWDVFFALAVFFAAASFPGAGLSRLIRWLLLASGMLSAAGLAGVATGDMSLRNVGILGYVGTFTLAAAAMAVFFARSGADIPETSP